jgi:hypothetical protein
MTAAAEVAWSTHVEEAGWLEERLAVPIGSKVTSIVPDGFEAYARLLHPAQREDGGDVRWAEVAGWSQAELKPNAQFHSVALPAEAGEDELPVCLPPIRGSLSDRDVADLSRLLRDHTATPNECWFCLWEGYAWQGRDTDPIPMEALDGPRVTLHRRDYVLYCGAVEMAEAIEDQSPNIWWPADRTWCVASEISLPWTYVGGSQEMIDALLALDGPEALPAGPDDPVRRVEEWVVRWVGVGAEDLMRGGHCRIETTRGVVAAWFERPGLTPGNLGVTAETPDGRKAGHRVRVEHGSEEYLHRLVSRHLANSIIDLVEG